MYLLAGTQSPIRAVVNACCLALRASTGFPISPFGALNRPSSLDYDASPHLNRRQFSSESGPAARRHSPRKLR
jgi:hypothetical protein